MNKANDFNLISSVNSSLTRKNFIKKGDTVIVGLSGGPDSVFLLHCLYTYTQEVSFTLIAAHLNHGWRPEADDDEQFCKNLAASFGIPIHTAHFQELSVPVRYNGSQEEIGRKARRFFLESIARTYPSSSIALGHHADDQIETFFIRLIRGASLSGLCSMKAREGMYIRPLLAFKKHVIIEYLTTHAIAYRTDTTNLSPLYLRNRIRNTLLPMLTTIDHRSDKKIEEAIESLQEAEYFIEKYIASLAAICIREGNTLHLPTFFAYDSFVQNRLLLQWLVHAHVPFTPSKNLLKEVMRFLNNTKNNTHTLYHAWTIKKKNSLAHIENTIIPESSFSKNLLLKGND